MAPLTVSLEDGFAQDHVLVRVDGATAYESTEVTTRLQTGLAAAIQLDAPESCRLEVLLPERGLSTVAEVDGGRTPYVRVSVVDGTVALASTEQPPYYA